VPVFKDEGGLVWQQTVLRRRQSMERLALLTLLLAAAWAQHTTQSPTGTATNNTSFSLISYYRESHHFFPIFVS
jgi:hypothetical protein